MKFTPNFNWPIAEDTDVVKQYPSTVDEPFKMTLEEQISTTMTVGFTVATPSFPIASIAPVEYDTLRHSSGTGLTFSGGKITVAEAGLYDITAMQEVNINSGSPAEVRQYVDGIVGFDIIARILLPVGPTYHSQWTILGAQVEAGAIIGHRIMFDVKTGTLGYRTFLTVQRK